MVPTGIQHTLRNLKRSHAPVARLLRYAALYKNLKPNAIIVYTMGKVGSTTVSGLLQNHKKDAFVYDVHYLNPENLKKDQQFHRKLYKKAAEQNIQVNILPDYISDGYFLRRMMKKKAWSRESLSVISLTRDPMAKYVSSFFQNAERFYAYDFQKELSQNGPEKIAEELKDLFLNHYLHKNGIDYFDSDPLTWFDEELKAIFDIDVYDSPFPHDRGYGMYSSDYCDVLVMRLEDLDDCYRSAIQQLTGVTVPRLKSENTASKKVYGGVYRAFKKNLRLPEDMLDRVYASKYATHFYTPDEITGFKKRWQQKRSSEMKRETAL
ncbi:putative capsular polysaccharide synthesis family protein [Rhodohalobacter mucosus]|uniref:Sulfotransferase family protein n=1 Tax=Rhodohalobacter mucosus TaxID=2079485 RepID=A0A316TY96_9BACT|nr:putative capsular polysaccharide synthesis family protein [Rhodohalobacter mucosus]PWN07812.1 hypothetical protein DDZ15_02020 [Rhodohalobacter mucosus]